MYHSSTSSTTKFGGWRSKKESNWHFQPFLVCPLDSRDVPPKSVCGCAGALVPNNQLVPELEQAGLEHCRKSGSTDIECGTGMYSTGTCELEDRTRKLLRASGDANLRTPIVPYILQHFEDSEKEKASKNGGRRIRKVQ